MKDTVSPPSVSFILTIFSGNMNQILHIVDLHYHLVQCYARSFDSSPTAVFFNTRDVTKKTIKRYQILTKLPSTFVPHLITAEKKIIYSHMNTGNI